MSRKLTLTETHGYRKRDDVIPRRIVSTRILISWNDTTKGRSKPPRYAK